MLLFGQYDVNNMIKVFQGHFGMKQHSPNEYTIDYYQLRFKINTIDKTVSVYLITRKNVTTDEMLLFKLIGE